MPNRGIKVWSQGDVLHAYDLNEYIMQQAVMVFDTEADRNSELTSVVTEGMVAYCKDIQKIFVYDGSNWIEYGTRPEIDAQESRTGQLFLFMEVI